MAVILKGLNDTLAQLTKDSETQTAMLTSLKEDILLHPDSDEEAEEECINVKCKYGIYIVLYDTLWRTLADCLFKRKLQPRNY